MTPLYCLTNGRLAMQLSLGVNINNMGNSMVSANRSVDGDQALQALVDLQASGYAGEVTPEAAYAFLASSSSSSSSVLVDVRTLPEWQFTGMPDLRAAGKDVLAISWKTYPQFQLNPNFQSDLIARVPSFNTPIFFLCRSGGRSLDAALAMTAAGYKYCFNVSGGFEGEPDASGHRCRTTGWKAANLPWSQT